MEKKDKNNPQLALVYWKICYWVSAQLGSQIKYNVTRYRLNIIIVVAIGLVVLQFGWLRLFIVTVLNF